MTFATSTISVFHPEIPSTTSRAFPYAERGRAKASVKSAGDFSAVGLSNTACTQTLWE